MELSHADLPSVQDLLRSGHPFVPFSEFSVQTLQAQSKEDVSCWIDNKLREGRPFVIRGFAQTDKWSEAALKNENLASLSASEAIPMRNCRTGRDVKMRLRDLLSQADHTRASSIREFLYAKDLNCPQEWVKALEALLPSPLLHLGSLDLFRVLPKDIAPEVLMAYVGTRKSFSGFHRCFSATVAVNLIIESEGGGPGSICFGTDRSSQGSYDIFMEEMGKSPHTDWANVSAAKLKSVEFPVYVTDQGPGDLVVFPAATAHQVWNISPMVTKVVWNSMHTSSIVSFFDYVQPAYQRQCQIDTGRVHLIPIHLLNSRPRDKEELELLLGVFQRLVDDEDTGRHSVVPVKIVDTQGAVVECNFCGLAIWNRHLHCEQCGDFDLCLRCFVSGRSCKHVADYTWAEIFPRRRCEDIIQAARNQLGDRAPIIRRLSWQKSLGVLAMVAMDARRQSVERLCHVCRDSHPAWKGIQCTQCPAFFCFRGLHRHFDIDLIPFLRKNQTWVCPKCSQVCNCRCCHFSEPYQSKDKPMRARIKPIDPRGRVLGFVDNVFDQKRGKKASFVGPSASPQPDLSPRGPKRPRMQTNNDELEEPHWQQRSSSAPSTNLGSSRTRRSITADPNSTNIVTPNHNHMNWTRYRISDGTESRNPAETGRPSDIRSTHYLSPSQHHPPSGTRDEFGSRRHTAPGDDTKAVSSGNEDIRVLEQKLDALRRYADELLELSLVDSHAKILERISQFETEIEQRRRRKAEVLLSNLHRDFPDLADLAREEARRRGL